MLDKIKQILDKWACKHEWECVKSIQVKDKFWNIIEGYKFLYICKKCGKIKWVKS